MQTVPPPFASHHMLMVVPLTLSTLPTRLSFCTIERPASFAGRSTLFPLSAVLTQWSASSL